MKGEYRQYKVKSADFWVWQSRIPESAFINLNRLAEEGWELVNAVPLGRVGGRTDFVSFILRREKGREDREKLPRNRAFVRIGKTINQADTSGSATHPPKG